MSELTNIRDDVAEIKEMVTKLVNGNSEYRRPERRLGIPEVAEVVAWFLNTKVADMQSETRILHICRARQIAVYICVYEFMHTHGEVAAFFNIDRTSTYHAIKKLTNVMEYDRKYKKLYKFCMDEIIKCSKNDK